MSDKKMVILTKTHYKIAEAAKILGAVYTAFYQLVTRRNIFCAVNGQKFIKAETIIELFSKYRPFDDCTINPNAPEVY